jgi:hypothetical protein
MAAHTSATDSADKSTRIEWMWQSNPNPWSKTQPEVWSHYSDVENDIIEEAYSVKKSYTVLDGYRIDFKNHLQIAENNPNRQRPIKRVVRKKNDTHLRVERFMHHPVALECPCGGQYGWVSTFIIEVRKSLKIQVEQLPSKDPSIVPMIVEKAAVSIIEEGNLLGRRLAAENITEKLEAPINNGIKLIWKCYTHLHSPERFIYKKVNEAMRLFSSPEQEEIWRSKVRTLGPFCLLLWDNPFNNKLTKNIKLYRGANLTEEQIKTYQDLSTKFKEYRMFQAFTSCSRNRQFAETFDNALFIMGMRLALIADPKAISEYLGEEEEELVLPDVSFRVQRMEYDPKKKKHLIYLQLRQRFHRKFF